MLHRTWECSADGKNARNQRQILGKEFDDVLQTTMGRTPHPLLGQTTVPVVGQGVQEQCLTELDGGIFTVSRGWGEASGFVATQCNCSTETFPTKTTADLPRLSEI
jgi:hypothetical protein